MIQQVCPESMGPMPAAHRCEPPGELDDTFTIGKDHRRGVDDGEVWGDEDQRQLVLGVGTSRLVNSEYAVM